jgi:hypothetical protein
VAFLADGEIVSQMVAPNAEAVARQLTHLGELVASRRAGGA